MTVCIACGMPMNEAREYAMGDVTKDYCVHCARPDGSMQNYEEKLRGMTDFIVRTQGLDPAVAERAAEDAMRRLPAWKGRFEP